MRFIIKRGGGLLQGDYFESFEGEETLAVYEQTKKGAVTANNIGNGRVYSFGFFYGTCYSAKIAPHVPLCQKNNEFYPIPYMKQNVLHDILAKYLKPLCGLQGKNIETAGFENGVVITNHTSAPISVNGIEGEQIYQYEIQKPVLLPRSSVFIRYPLS